MSQLKTRPQSSQSFFIEHTDQIIKKKPHNVFSDFKETPVLSDSIELQHQADSKATQKRCRWESADVNSKSNIKLNIFASNNKRTAYEIINRPKSALQKSVSRNRSQERNEKQSKSNLQHSTSQVNLFNKQESEDDKRLFLNFSKIHKIDDEIDQVPSIEIDKNDQQISDNQVDWCSLPHEIWLMILSNLGQSDLAQFGRTSKMFYHLYSDNQFCK